MKLGTDKYVAAVTICTLIQYYLNCEYNEHLLHPCAEDADGLLCELGVLEENVSQIENWAMGAQIYLAFQRFVDECCDGLRQQSWFQLTI